MAGITGASTGIGFALATLAAKHGYDIIVVVEEPLIEAAAADFKQFGTNVQSTFTACRRKMCLVVPDWDVGALVNS